MNIRPMKKSHVKNIYQLGLECLPGEAWEIDGIMSELKNPNAVTFVAIENKQIVGFANAHIILDEGYLNNMAITESFRRKGIGGELLEHMVIHAKKKGAGFLSLEVRKSNKNAIKFYQKHGFVYVGERKSFYENPVEDALIYTKHFVELLNEVKRPKKK